MKIGVSHIITFEELLTESGEYILTADGDTIMVGVRNNYPLRIPIRKACNGYYLRWYYNGYHYWFFRPGNINMNTEGENYITTGTRKIEMGSGQVTYGQIKALRTILNTKEVNFLTDVGWMNIRIDPASVIVSNNYINGYEFEFVAIIGSREMSVVEFSPVEDVPVIPPVPDPGICEVIIGTQVWMCKNYDAAFPGSRVYNDDEANRAIYGGLYTYTQIMASGFCPPGWHVPTATEWCMLTTYLGGLTVAGGKLKEAGVTHWDAPNTGAVDTYGFSALGAGYHLSWYNYLKQYSWF